MSSSAGYDDLTTHIAVPSSSHSVSPRRSSGSPLRVLPLDNIVDIHPPDSAAATANMMPSPSKSYAFPPPSPERRVSAAHQRASTAGIIRQRRSSPLLHEIQGPSRRLSSHQVLLLTPFGGPVPADAMASAANQVAVGAGTMARGSSSMGGPRSSLPNTAIRSTGMAPQPSSVGMGREMDPSSSASRPLPPLTQRFNTRHQSLVQPVNPSPLSQPMATIQSGSEQGSESGGSSQPLSRDQSHSSHGEQESEQRDGLGPLGRMTGTTSTGNVVPMTRSNSLPVLTLRELDALKEKDGELGIARGTHWAWISGDDDEVSRSPELPAMPRTTPPIRPFAFQDPFAPLGTLATPGQGPTITNHHAHASSTAPDYHYSPTTEPRRMSEAASATSSPWSTVSPTDGRSRGASVATVTPATSATPIAHFSPPLLNASTFNSRASMSAIDQDQPIPFGPSGSPKGETSTLPVIRPRILRYKTSPARFTGLGLDIVVKPSNGGSSGSGSTASASTVAPTSSKERRRSSQRSLENEARRRSSQLSEGQAHDERRRRSSATSNSSAEGRKGTWAVLDVVDTLSTTELSLPSTSTSSIHSIRSSSHTVSSSSPRGSVYTIEHVSSRSHPSVKHPSGKSFNSLPSRKGKTSATAVAGPGAVAFAFETFTAAEGFSLDPLAFPRRGSLAVLSQTALGPWAAKASGVGAAAEELLGAPKGNWQDRRGSWAEGWVKK